jgi:exosortase
MERILVKSPLISSLPLWSFLAIFVIGTWPTLTGLAGRWLKFDESYSHGFLVLAVCSFLCVDLWRRQRPVTGFNWAWLVPLVVFAVMHMAGTVLLIEAFQQVTLVPLLLCGLLALWGWRQTSPFFVPVVLLVFTLPFWDYLSWPLQLMTVAFNQFMLSWFDIEFIVEGVFVYFPGVGAFEVANGCSGLRYFLVGVTLSLLYGQLNLRRWSSLFWLVLAGVVFSIAANWLRVFIIIYVGYESNMTSSLINEHDFFGWWVFAATLIPLFFIGRWLEKKDASEHSASLHEPNVTANEDLVLMRQFSVVLPVIVIAGVSWFAVPSAATNVSEGVQGGKHNVKFVDLNEWLPLFDRQLSGWSPIMASPDLVMERSFVKRDGLSATGQRDETLFIALYSYHYQRPGNEVVQYGNRLYDASLYLPERTFSVEAGANISFSGLTLRQRRSNELLHLAYGYYVEGRWERFDLQAKLAQLPGIFNSRTDASVLVIGLDCENCNSKELLGQLAPNIRQTVQKHLDSVYLSVR